MSSLHEAEKLSLKGIAASLQASEEIHFLGENRQQVYAWMEMGLRQQQSVQQGRRARGSAAALPGEDDRAQVPRLLARYQAQGRGRPATAIYFSKTYPQKESSSPPAPSLFRFILRLEKTLPAGRAAAQIGFSLANSIHAPSSLL